MNKFIKSSSRTKPDPQYYKRIADKLGPQRDELFDLVSSMEERGFGDTVECKVVYQKAMKLSAKVCWAAFCIPVAMRMRDQLNERK